MKLLSRLRELRNQYNHSLPSEDSTDISNHNQTNANAIGIGTVTEHDIFILHFDSENLLNDKIVIQKT
jgi:hypothetical protein